MLYKSNSSNNYQTIVNESIPILIKEPLLYMLYQIMVQDKIICWGTE